MKVAIYSHSFPPSIDGVCRRMSSLVYELLLAKHEVLIFTLEEDLSGLDLYGLPTPQFVTLESCFPAGYPAKRVAAPTLTNVSLIWQALEGFRPDALHVTVDALTLAFCAVALALDVPIAGSIHTDVDKILRSLNKAEWVVRTGWFLESADSLFLDCCATTSQSYKEELTQRGCWIDHVVLTSVNTAVFRPACITAEERRALRSNLTFGKPDAFLMVYVGRLSREKSIDVLLEALRHPDLKNVFLALFGDGPIAEEIGLLHGEAHRVFCRPGFLTHKDLAQVYAAADVHVSASVFETLGNTVLEAHAAGIPVIVPCAQGFRDTVTAEVDGLFFDPHSPEGLVKCIQQLQADPERRRAMGQAGRAKVEDLSAAAVATDYLAWYKRAIARRELRSSSPVTLLALTLAVWPLALLFMIILRAYDMAILWWQQATALPALLSAAVPGDDPDEASALPTGSSKPSVATPEAQPKKPLGRLAEGPIMPRVSASIARTP